MIVKERKILNLYSLVLALFSLGLTVYTFIKAFKLPFDRNFLIWATHPDNRVARLFLIGLILTFLMSVVLKLFEPKKSLRMLFLSTMLVLGVAGSFSFFWLKSKEQAFVHTLKKGKKKEKKAILLTTDTIHSAVEAGSVNTLKYKVSKASVAALNAEDTYGRTPLGIAIACDDERAVEILIKSGKIDAKTPTKYAPSIVHEPVQWLAGLFLKRKYDNPLNLVRSKKVERVLKNSGKLNKEQTAVLSDRMQTLELKKLEKPFYVKYKNALLLSSAVIAGAIAMFGVYKYFNAWFSYKTLAFVGFVYALVVGVFYLTGYMYNNLLETMTKAGKLTALKREDLKNEFESVNFFKRITLLYDLKRLKNE